MTSRDTKDITVYDPPMCCSTGVCGPEVDPALARFSADLAWLAAEGVVVRRFNLSQEPGAFVQDPDATEALKLADSALPLIKAGESVVSSGAYPSRADLATWAGLETPQSETRQNGCCPPAQEAPQVEAVQDETQTGCCPPAQVETTQDEPQTGCCPSTT